MTRRGKKTISLFLCLLMLFSLLPAPAFAEQQTAAAEVPAQEAGTDPAAAPYEETADADVAEDAAEDEEEPDSGPAEEPEPVPGEELPQTEPEPPAEEDVPEDAGSPEESGETEEEYAPRQFLPEDSWSEAGGADPDALLTGFAQQALDRAASGGNMRAQGYSIEGRGFSAAESYAFETLKNCVTETAAGNITYTVYTVDFTVLPESDHVWTAESLGYAALNENNIGDAYKKVSPSLDKILHALLLACPFELYWFDKTDGIKCWVGDILVNYTSGALTLESITYRFVVAGDYSAGDFTVDTQYAARIQTAVTNAQVIAGSAAGMSDYEKLKFFKNRICELTSYNSSAGSSSTATPYGNPWQLIWVFDGDSSTKVVCEGYSKAFQYLCDLCSFSSPQINCCTATGTCNETRHMWNIVRMDDGKYYLVDVTNCDTGKAGAPDLLFLKGWRSGSLSGGYSFHGENSAGIGYPLKYVYDSGTLQTYTEAELTLSGTHYHVHQASAAVIENRVEPTYEHEGSYEEVVYCKNCGEEISRTLVPVARLTPLAAPVLKEIVNRKTVIELEWEPVEGAKSYRVLRRTADAGWAGAVTVGETAATRLADGSAEHGTAYVYTVFCYDPDLDETAGGYDGAGLAITRHVMPDTLQNARAATCTEAGYSGDCVCTECGETVPGHIIDALGHEEELRNEKAASYTEEGYSGDVYCSRCGILLREGSAVPKLEAVVAEAQSLTEGSSLSLTAPELSGRSVNWSFADADGGQYAALSRAGILTAKAVTERHTVTVLAEAADDSVKVLFPVEIIPSVKSVILFSEAGEDLTGRTVVFDLNNPETNVLRFRAAVLPEAANADVTWTTGDRKGTCADYAAENGVLTVSGIRAAGTVTLTAKACDGSGKTAKVSLKIVRYAASVQIEEPSLPFSDGEYILRGGQSLRLKTDVSGAPGLTDRTIAWSLSDDSIPYANIGSTGRLSTKAVYEPVSITVTAQAKSGAADELRIRLVPSAAAVQIRLEDTLLAKGQQLFLPLGGSLTLTGNALPANAMQGGSWKSSSRTVAAVDADGRVTALKTGTATLTFTAADGSGKSTNVKIRVGKSGGPDRLTPEAGVLKSGKTLQLTALNVSGGAAAAKDLKWESSNPAAAKVSATGKVTAKAVSFAETVVIRAYSPYEPENVLQAELNIMPAKDSLSLWSGGENLTGKALAIDAGQIAQAELTAALWQAQNDSPAEADAVWSSNNPKVATVENGLVRFTGSTGSATITAKAGKISAKTTFRVIHAVTDISIAAKGGAAPAVIAGKSLQLSAQVSPANATTKGLTWSSSDPAAATVSGSGKVTAKTVYSAVEVTVTAAAKDGSGVTGTYSLTVYPAVSWVKIEQLNENGTIRVMNGRTVPAAAGDVLRLQAVCFPSEALQEQGAAWSSSNSRAASVDADGTVHVKAKGSVKITARAGGKSAAFTLKIG